MASEESADGTEHKKPTPREIAASIARATRFRDPIVDYNDSDPPNLWVDVRGKVDSLRAPVEDCGVVPVTIHPTANDEDDVTRVWYRSVSSATDRTGHDPPKRAKTDCDRCGDKKVVAFVDRNKPALCGDCEVYVANLEAPKEGREITPMDRRWR